MSYLVLARKWRPQLFEDVVGQKHVTKTLQNAIVGNRVPHALLFTGTKGVGKTSVARILAKALNCQDGPTPGPCNRCQFCKDISAGVSIDVLEIDGASNTGVDDVRELRENVRYLPSKGSHKVYIIDEVHMLSNSAFNALLKTLEEPPEHVVFIFATTEPHKIPPTILSRCQRYDFKRIPARDILAHLKLIVSDEKVQISDKGLALIAREAEGSMRDAQSILDQAISFAGRDVSYDEIVEILGIIDRKLFYETSLSIIERKPQRCLDIIEDVYNYGYDIKEFYKGLLEQFRNLVVAKVTENPSRLIDLPDSEIEDLATQGALVGIGEIQQLFSILANSEEEIIRSNNPRLVMEMTLVRMAHTRPLLSIDDILCKIDNLERKLLNLNNEGNAAAYMPLEKPQFSNPSSQTAAITEIEHLEDTDDTQPSEAESGIKGGDTKETWLNLIGFVRKKRPLLAAILELGQLINMDDGKIDIGLEKNSVFMDSINEPQNKKDLADIFREFFQREMALNISVMVPNSDSASIAKKNSKGSDEVRKLRDEALNNPIVHDAINIFGGKVIEIKTKQV
ncbi:MAG: DNA polymerase III subunit gamma/tau [Deltaproteobacteria bacterium]|nr:MAG: DNA polymerase III subunit gamma/tau [Deltaproteobacteria bacterium]